MIIVHDIFICKPGNASKLVKKFKEAMASMEEPVQFMTDVTGQFNKVVMVTQTDDKKGQGFRLCTTQPTKPVRRFRQPSR